MSHQLQNDPSFESTHPSHLAAAAAAAASLMRNWRIMRSIRHICRSVIFGALQARRGRGLQRGPL